MTAAPIPLSSAPSGTSGDSARPHTATYCVFGVMVRVSASDAKLLLRLCDRLPPGSTAAFDVSGNQERTELSYSMSCGAEGARSPEDPQPRGYVGRAGGAVFIETADDAVALDAFEAQARLDVATATKEWVFVHAGVVGWRGGAIVIPAPSLHGKSTLVLALLDEGATYYSDEFAVLDRHGMVHPFRSPISIRTADGGSRRVQPENSHVAPPLPIRKVVSTGFDITGRWSPTPGSKAEAVMALLSNTIRARLAPGEILTILARAVEQAAFLTSLRGEAREAAASLLEDPDET